MSQIVEKHPGALPGNQGLPPDDVIFGYSAEMQRLRLRLEKVCSTDIPVLIQGDTGTGKEVLSRWMHARSPWCAGPFVKVNCAAVPGPLLESELFGYRKGAFTGANTSKPGRVELARGGTLLLDEISNLDLVLQAKLLQVLQDGRFSRLGDEEERRLEARVICTSNFKVEAAVQVGQFRPDLYYRINVFRVNLPRLSERRRDIPLIASYLRERISRDYEREVAPFSSQMLEMLCLQPWNGNMRELENRIARYVLLGVEETPEEEPMVREYRAAQQEIESGGAIPLKSITEKACREQGREAILRALQANRWNRRRAAEALKISYRALLYKICQAGLMPKRPRGGANSSPPAPICLPAE